MAELTPSFPDNVLPFPDPGEISPRQSAVMRGIGAVEDSPDDAARAHALSEATGAPPQMVHEDQDDWERRTKEQLTANLIHNNPHLQQYVNSHPLAASISNDDLGNLHELSEGMNRLMPLRLRTLIQGLESDPIEWVKLARDHGPINIGMQRAWKDMAEKREQAVQAAMEDPWIPGKFRKEYPELSSYMDLLSNNPVGYAIRKEYELFGGPMGLMSIAGGGVAGFAAGVVEGFHLPEKLARDIAAISEAEMAGMTGRAHVGELAEGTVRRLQQEVAERSTQEALGLAKPFLDAGETPPEGLHWRIDRARAAMSKIDQDALEKVTKQAQSTNTFARDKDFQLNNFLSLWPDSHIEVPAEVIQKLYGEKPISSDDGILGWVPNLSEQMESAALTGEKVQIPRNLWMTNADPEIRKALKDDAAWRPGAMSTNRADEVLKTPPEMMEGPTGHEGLVDGLHRISGLETPDAMISRFGKAEPADFRNIIPEGTHRRMLINTIDKKGNSVRIEASHHFLLRDILPNLHHGQLDEPARVLSEFFGKQLDRLAGNVPVSIISRETMAGHLPGQDVYGFYDPTNHRIILRKDIVDGTSPSDVSTGLVLHEAAHAISSNAINNFPVLSSYVGKLMDHTRDTLEKVNIEFRRKHDYAFKNEKEFIAEAISNPEFQTALNAIPIPPELAKGLRIDQGSMWHAVRQIVKDMWEKLVGKIPSETVMDAIFNLNQAFEDINQRLEGVKGELQRLGQRPDLMEALREEEPSKPTGTVRFYHGGTDPTSGGPRWVTPSREYARKFRAGEEDNEVHYVDIPKESFKSDPEIAQGYDDINDIYRHFEAPERIAKELKSLDEWQKGRVKEIPQEEKDIFAAKALGMSKKVYTTMRDLALKRRDEKAKFLSEQVAKADAEQQTKEWKDNKEIVRELVRDHVMRLPDIAADHFLRTGELFNVKYRRTRLDARYISDLSGLDEEHYNADRGLKPDAIAEALGFQSGDQMLDALRNLKGVRDAEGLTPAAHISKVIDALTDREMKDRYGRFEENLLASAKDHVLSASNYDILHEHILHYADKLGLAKTPFTKDHIISMAQDELSKIGVGRIDSTRAMQNVGLLGREVENAATAGEWDRAFQAAQNRAIAFQVAKLHMQAEKTLAKFGRYQAQYRKREPGAVGIEWSNAIQDILDRVGVKINRNREDINREYIENQDLHGGLAEFVKAKSLPEIMEHDPDFPAGNQGTLTVAGFLLDPNYRADWKEMKWGEFESVFNSVDSLHEHGRNDKKLNLAGESFAREKVIDDLIETLYDVFKVDDGTTDRPINQATIFKTIWAGLIQMETLWSRLARDDPSNPFMKIINNPTMAAGNHLADLEREVSRKWAEIGKSPDDPGKLVENHLFFEPNERGGEVADIPMRMTTRHLLTILQNVGNWSNFDKLTRGHGLGNAQVAEQWKKNGYQQWMNDPVMNWIFKHTTKEDWDRAQAIGKVFEEMFSRSETVYYNMGARPGPRIGLRPIETPFGTYEGWYHPIIYDSQRPQFWLYDEETGQRKPVGKATTTNPMDDAGIYQPATPSGYQKQRTGYAAPLLLSFDQVPFRMKQILNDIAMRPVVTELNKVFSDGRFQTAMTKTYGPQYTKLLKDYLRDISGQRRYSSDISTAVGKVAEYILANMTTTLIGFNPSTVLKHFPTALQTSAAQVGHAAFMAEFANTWFNPLGWKNAAFALENSSEVARRGRNWRETISGAAEDLFPGVTAAPLSGVVGEKWGARLEAFRQGMIKVGATPVAWSDMASVVPMWNLVYKREMRAHGIRGNAIEAANFAVRQAHGSTAITARAGIMRGGTVARAVVPFYNFFSDMLQRQYQTAWRAKDAVGYLKDGNYQKGLGEMKKVALGIWAYYLFPAMVEYAISGPEPKEDDSYLKVGSHIIANTVNTLPVVRDLVGTFLSGQDPTFSVYGTAYKNVQNFTRDMEKGNFGEAKLGKTIKHTAAFIGTTLGLANAQMGRWGQFAYEYATGKQDPEGPLTAEGLPQWYRALRFGDIKKRKPK